MSGLKKIERIIVHADAPEPLAKQVSSILPETEVFTCNTYADLPPALEEVIPDAVFTIRFAGTQGFPREALFGEYGPAFIHVGGSGTDHLGQWDPQATIVTNSAGVAAGMMAEYAIGAFLHFSLDISGLERDKRERNWGARSMRPLAGKTLLIAGLGHTGRAVAGLAKALGMNVIGSRANPVETPNVDEVIPPDGLRSRIGQADFVLVCMPLLEETWGMFDEEMFLTMKPGAVLVDVSRGGIVREAPLVEALHSGRLAGAALDVFEKEPLPPDNILWTLENVILSPHCSSVFEGWEKGSIELFCRNVLNWNKGCPLENIVDPNRGY